MTITDRVVAVATAEALLAEARKKWAAVVEYQARMVAARPPNTPTFAFNDGEAEARAELVNARLDLLEARSALSGEG